MGATGMTHAVAGSRSGFSVTGTAPSLRRLRSALTIARFSRFCHAFTEALAPAEPNYNYRLD
jgi:hypothetical protein